MKSNRALLYALIVGAVLVVALFALVPPEAMLWVKALHILAVIAWMAGMLYLPRLFVYHAQSEPASQQAQTFKIMERRLLKGIMNPAMVVTWAAGLWLAWSTFAFQGGWLHAKIALVLVLSGVHGYLSASQRRFERNENRMSAKFWRTMNEVPTLLMVAIVILVVVKPF
ncbi:protoporphyrinogen oxidase HemJ [Aureimonas frigidaquae]|uniref:Protoporphyrinogen IX oxidase n=1 Tax=Aureimonas frigidaquae TaxID=424757 RepID=A0A0P0Z0N7_9HYPH|nr:protoporphyrinogen oxidase HemJ [Aureimonas frigidaquae]BAT27507.1 integral membrane protein [Aureimonas frigidaquae]